MHRTYKKYKPWLHGALALLLGTQAALAQSTTIGGGTGPVTIDGGYTSDYNPDGLFILADGTVLLQTNSTWEHGNLLMNNLGSWGGTTGSLDLFVAPGTNTISGTTAPNFFNANFDIGANTMDITNTSGINVTGSLSFNNGITSTVRSASSTGAIHFADGANYTNSNLSDAQFVNGYVSKTGNDAFVFPVGNQAGTDLRSLSISAPGVVTDEISVAYWRGDVATALDPTGGAHSRTALNPAGVNGVDKLASVSPIEFWDWVPVAGTSAVTISVSISDFSGIGGFSAANIRLAGWNTSTSQWDNLSGSVGAASNLENTTVTGTVADMSLYSAIAIGGVTQPLPVQLVRFTAVREAATSALSWTTTEESNASHFEIQRSTNARDWSAMGTRAAAGESKAILHYTFTDPYPASGINYYRLKMIDKDATFAYSRIENVHFDSAAQLVIYPNPASKTLFLKETDVKELSIIASNGRVVYKTNAVSSQGVELGGFVNGTYFVKVTQRNGAVSTQKLIILK
ncbi:T9SS type A sorting domain-containing protein [Dyadobacter sp. 32]|uniref:T9SS type A sorting domain-containing protein n=1 Tax=Dyadobacter sp. 32 TaxID=538966 RepID=UPI0011EC8C94